MSNTTFLLFPWPQMIFLNLIEVKVCLLFACDYYFAVIPFTGLTIYILVFCPSSTAVTHIYCYIHFVQHNKFFVFCILLYFNIWNYKTFIYYQLLDLNNANIFDFSWNYFYFWFVWVTTEVYYGNYWNRSVNRELFKQTCL